MRLNELIDYSIAEKYFEKAAHQVYGDIDVGREWATPINRVRGTRITA